MELGRLWSEINRVESISCNSLGLGKGINCYKVKLLVCTE